MSLEGVIGVPTAVHSRWASFWQCLEALERPPGWVVKPARGSSVAANRNLIAQWALEQGARWVFWLDDDMEFQPDALVRLLAHAQPVVVGHTLNRKPPFEAIWLTSHPAGGLAWVAAQAPDAGLQRIEAATSGGLLTRADVLAAVGYPWWTLGQFTPDQWQDDIWFCERVRDCGFLIHGDPSVRMGHITDTSLWPVWQDGRWHTLLARGAEPFAMMPTAPLDLTTGPVAGLRSPIG